MTETSLAVDTTELTGAQLLVRQLRDRGVRILYGVPGGDCSIDIIAAAAELGIRFVLTRSENAAAMMASAGAQIDGTLGVVLTTRGPGLANGVNGVACAMLDRCPMLFISDGYENEQAFVSHQRFDQQRVLEPVVKGSLRVDSPDVVPAVVDLLDLALSRPAGPVYLEVTGKGMRGRVTDHGALTRAFLQPRLPAASAESVAIARRLMERARRPVLIAGLQTRESGAAAALRALVARWRCPVLTTYMGKGAIADADPLNIGHFMAGGAEDELMKSADLIVSYGMDPIELLPKPWKYGAPVIEIASRAFARNHFLPAVALTGELDDAATQLASDLSPSPWAASEIDDLKAHMRARATFDDDTAITPTHLARTVCERLPADVRIAVDAGAHMLPVMAFFEAKQPCDALISRGLATMAYGLPSAIGAAMADPSRHVVAFTGDGGLMMCIAELATAAQLGCRLTVVVFNDSAIAMIGVKQNQRGFERVGMDYSPSDFAMIAEGFGCKGMRVKRREDLPTTIDRALAHPGTVVVDVAVDPSSYDRQIRSLRG